MTKDEWDAWIKGAILGIVIIILIVMITLFISGFFSSSSEESTKETGEFSIMEEKALAEETEGITKEKQLIF